MKNLYEGCIEDWKFDIMVSVARRLGFSGNDLEDALQVAALSVLDFHFDSAKANGVDEAPILAGLVRDCLRNLRRSEMRHKRRKERYELLNDAQVHELDLETDADRNELRQRLPEFDRRVYDLIAEGYSVKEVSVKMDCRWHTANSAAKRAAAFFEKHGLIGERRA